MKRYDSYKDSGVESLGVVPESWNTSRFKYHHIENDETVGEDSSNFPLLSLTKRGVILRDVESGKGKFPESFDNYKIIEHNDLIFCLYDIEETPRTVGISENYGMITGSYKIFKTKDTVLPKFTYFTYLVIDDVKGLKPYYTGLRNVIRPETFKNLPFNFPPLSEQKQIVSFLDTKTSLIDSLIEKTQRKIELLKEKRTSLINEVVTKGLNPNVEMKDSDVEWIGEIPSHWDMVKYKNLGDRTTISIGVEDFNDTDVIHYSIPNVQTFGKGVKEFGGDIDSSKLLFKGGELIISKLNPRKSCVSIVESLENEVIVGSGEFVVLTPKRTDIKFLFYFLKNQTFTDYLDSSVESVTRSHQRVNPSIIYNTFVPLPPHPEQQQIVSYLDEQTHLIDNTISIEEKRIELLKEYRQSLISEVVTGKIKVTTNE